MKNHSKGTQLECQKIMLMHTLDFLITHYCGYFVLDDNDFQKQFYIQEKAEVEKYFAQGNLTQLNTMLKKFQKKLYLKRDENYPGYMESFTGFPLKLYNQLSTNIQRIWAEKKVSNEEDALEVEFLIAIYKNTVNHTYNVAKLGEYLDKYRNDSKTVVYRNILQTEVPAGSVLIDNPLSKLSSSRRTSPNGKNCIELHRSGKEKCLRTYVVAEVEDSNGTIYSVIGKGEKIKIEWVDNDTILIHTSEEYESVMSTNKLRAKNTIIYIKYVYAGISDALTE